MKIKFTASGGFDSYEEFSDGSVVDVTPERAEYLLKSFPAHFAAVVETKAVEAPTSDRAERGPKKNR